MLHGCPPSPDAWGRLNVVTPFHHLSGDSHINSSLKEGPLRHLDGKQKPNLSPIHGHALSVLSILWPRARHNIERRKRRKRLGAAAAPARRSTMLSPSGVQVSMRQVKCIRVVSSLQSSKPRVVAAQVVALVA